jgi:hypothetical protein
MSSTYANKPGKGAIFSTEKKSEKGPDYKGNLILDRDYKAGEEVKLAGWQKTSRRGPMVSLSIDSWKPDPDWKPDPEKQRERENTYRPGGMTRFDDDVPFSPEHR